MIIEVNQIIIHQGRMVKYLYLILDGQVTILQNKSENTILKRG